MSIITAKYPGRCSNCTVPVRAGDRIHFERNASGTVVAHEDCAATLPAPPRAPSFTVTGEQSHVLELFGKGSSLAIEAGAGTGKTSTLQLLAESTRRRGQYLAFNKAIVQDAGARMPESLACSTAHSLAYRAVGAAFRDRLSKSRRMRSGEIATLLRIAPVTLAAPDGEKLLSEALLGGLVMASVTRFCQSAEAAPSPKHTPWVKRLTPGGNADLRDYLAPYVIDAWTDLMASDGILPFRHDHYLKAWQLSDPRIPVDYILFDECQDANPVILAIVEAQGHAQRVYVGDSQQAIYGFTGAINALERIREQGGETAFLRQSFRFGPPIAAVANTILDRIPEAKLRLLGSDAVESTVAAVEKPSAILTRTNATAVRTVIRLQSLGRVPALVGGADDVVAFARAAEQLMQGRAVEHPDLACFANWSEVRSYLSEDEQGAELRLLVKLVTDFGVPAILAALVNPPREEAADVVVSTAHKSKGRQWSAVKLAGDFPPAEKQDVEELRLLYVAATRARHQLDITAIDWLNSSKAGGQDVEAATP